MSTSTAIGRVSESLRSLLRGEMVLTPAVPVTILAPDETGGGPRRVNLFLYKVLESPFLRNQEWQVSSADPNRLTPPPLSLTLYYLMTAYANNDANLGNATRHEILGDAMRVLYEHPIVPSEYLAGDLGGAREQVKVVQNGLDMEELGQVWHTFSQPFRLSVLYEVSLVQLDQSAEQQRPMPHRVRSVGAPDVRAPFAPPVVESITPLSGPAGTAVTFHGRHLDGWNAYVTFLRQPILAGAAINGDQFQAVLPVPLLPGFYEIRVDVAHLHRNTFFFEVTA